jgi:hypothetical protein
MFRTLTTELAINMSETEVRTLSVHKVANPVLQVKIHKNCFLKRHQLIFIMIAFIGNARG